MFAYLDAGSRTLRCLATGPTNAPQPVLVAVGTDDQIPPALRAQTRSSGEALCVEGTAIDPSVVSPIVLSSLLVENATLLRSEGRRVLGVSRYNADLHLVIIVGRTVDQAVVESQIQSVVRHDVLLNQGEYTPGNVLRRLDKGSNSREAKGSVALVFVVAGSILLGLAAVSILAGQLAAIKQKSWFFGLARAVGARSTDLIWLVVLEVFTIAFAGALTSLAVATVFSSTMSEWSRKQFGTEVVLVDSSAIIRLVSGFGVLLAVGALAPAIRASRTDPIEALESNG